MGTLLSPYRGLTAAKLPFNNQAGVNLINESPMVQCEAYFTRVSQDGEIGMDSRQVERIESQVAAILGEYPKDKLDISHIRIIPDVNMHGEDILRIIIVSADDNPALWADVMSNVALEVLDCLREQGLSHFPVTYFVGSAEWPQYEKGLAYAMA